MKLVQIRGLLIFIGLIAVGCEHQAGDPAAIPRDSEVTVRTDHGEAPAFKMLPGESREVSFFLNNHTTETKKIQSIETSCGCAKPKVLSSILVPQVGTEMRIDLRADRVGVMDHFIRLTFDGGKEPEFVMSFRTVVEQPVLTVPESMCLSLMPGKHTRKLEIRSTSDSWYKLLLIDCDHPQIDTSVCHVSDKHAELDVNVSVQEGQSIETSLRLLIECELGTYSHDVPISIQPEDLRQISPNRLMLTANKVHANDMIRSSLPANAKLDSAQFDSESNLEAAFEVNSFEISEPSNERLNVLIHVWTGGTPGFHERRLVLHFADGSVDFVVVTAFLNE